MKRAKQRRTRLIHPLDWWQFRRGLRRMGELSIELSANLGAFVDALYETREAAIALMPDGQQRLAAAEASAVIAIARAR